MFGCVASTFQLTKPFAVRIAAIFLVGGSKTWSVGPGNMPLARSVFSPSETVAKPFALRRALRRMAGLLSFWFSGRWRALAKGTARAVFVE